MTNSRPARLHLRSAGHAAKGLWLQLLHLMPRLGEAGSRFSHLHLDTSDELAPDASANQSSSPDGRTATSAHQRAVEAHLLPVMQPWDTVSRMRLRVAIYLGMVGSLAIAIGGIGAGAFPVVDNPYHYWPLADLLTRMLQTSTVLVYIGVALLVIAWTLLARFAVPRRSRPMLYLPQRTLWRIFWCWSLPLLATAPLFSQDIYSYLAQGSITARGLDPYAGGPIDLLGPDNPLARSVPLMWAHSPSPYGPVAVVYGAVISWITNDAFVWAILAHRILAIASLVLCIWALRRLAERCGVAPQTAIWIGVLNPLTLLHLIGGVHNEAVMLGLLLAGMELVFRGTETSTRRWSLITVGFALITMSGLIKVTAFVALGFAGVALARSKGQSFKNLGLAAVYALVVATTTAAIWSLGSGVGTGWITSQGGATSVYSWMSITSFTGLLSGLLSGWLGLGDHINTAVAITRAMGVTLGLVWVIRMLWAAWRGRIHPLGAMGAAYLILILFFPVVQPWYLLWAILPLAAWANTRAFQQATIVFSTFFSFAVLPRGLSLSPSSVAVIYGTFIILAITLIILGWFASARFPTLHQAIRSTRIEHLRPHHHLHQHHEHHPDQHQDQHPTAWQTQTTDTTHVR